MNAETLAGQIAHSGGISLTKGSTRVEVTDFVIGTTAAPSSPRCSAASGSTC